MPRILIVDDEPSIVLALKDELLFEGFEVETASTGPSALEQARNIQPDVMLLDVMLPEMNGFEVCRQLRQEMPDLWIIMLTVRESEIDRVRGLELGADDYVTKPFSLREVIARINVGLRRQENQPAIVSAFGNIEIDENARRVFKNGNEIALTATEFDILRLLVSRADKVISRDQILNAIWGEDVVVVPRVVDTHMASLRKKIEDDPANPSYLHSVRGAGYRLDVTPTES